MKKLIIIPLLIIWGTLIAQVDSIVITDITGSDTTIFVQMYGNVNFITFDFTNFNSNTSTLEVGYSHVTSSFAEVSKQTLDVSMYSKTVNGITKSRITYRDIPVPCIFAFTLTKVSTTTGTLKYYR